MGTPARYYSSTAVRTTLSSSIGTADESIQVASSSGFPSSYPFTLALEKDTANEEILTITGKTGTAFNVVRGIDGTSARPHSAGMSVEHVIIALDMTDFRAHEAAEAGVHGIDGGSVVVGTTDTQTLTNKTLSAPTINGGIATGVALSAPTVGDFTNAQHDHSTAAKGGNIPQSSVTGLVSGLASKESVANVTAHTSATSAHGATGAVVGTTNTQTLSNKTLTAPTINGATVTGTVTATGATISGGTSSGQTITSGTLGGNLAAGGNRVTGLGEPVAGSDSATKTYVDTAVTNLVAGAPGALNTLDELAAALGDDANFAATVTNQLAGKVNDTGDTMTGTLTMSGGAKVTGLPTPTVSSDAVPLGYVTTLYGSTADAATSATAAASSATSAATSASQAASSATAAGSSATSASGSAATATAQASAASSSATQASTSASNAASSATNAANSASAASASQIAAAASQTAAAGSASTASTKASEAAASAVVADGSADLAQDWATKMVGTVDGVEYSAKYYASIANPAGQVTETGAATLTNKTMSGSANTFSNIPQSAITGLTTDLDGKVGTRVAKAGDTMTGALTMGGANVNLRPTMVSVGTVTGVTTATTTTSLTTSTGGLRGGTWTGSTLSISFGSSAGSTEFSWFQNLTSGTVITLVDSSAGTLTFTFTGSITKPPWQPSLYVADGQIALSATSTAPAFTSFGVSAGTTATLSYSATAYAVATSASSITIPTTHFVIGSTVYQTSAATISGGTITLASNPGSVTGQTVGYYSTPAAVRGIATDGTTSDLFYDPAAKRWEIDGVPFDGGAITHSASTGITLTAASRPIVITEGFDPGAITLPNTSGLSVGRQFEIVGNHGGSVTVRDSNGTTLATLTVYQTGIFTVLSTSSQSWDVRVTAQSPQYLLGFGSPGQYLTTNGSTVSWSNLTLADGSVTNAKLANSSLIINGTSVSLGSFATVAPPADANLVRPVLASPEEIVTLSATAATGTVNFDARTSGVTLFTSNATGNWTLNVRGDASNTLNSMLATGTAISVTFLVTQGANAFAQSAFQIDGAAQTVRWMSGFAPTAGNANGIDAWSFTIIKTAATPTYTVLGQMTRFA